MDVRRTLAAFPLQVLLGAATLVALAATLVVASGDASLALTLRLAALTTVLFVFAVGFAAGPLAERYL